MTNGKKDTTKKKTGGTLIFSYIRRLGQFFGFKILNLNNFWVYRKMNIFWGMKICGYFGGVITILDYIKGSFLYIFWGC